MTLSGVINPVKDLVGCFQLTLERGAKEGIVNYVICVRYPSSIG